MKGFIGVALALLPEFAALDFKRRFISPYLSTKRWAASA